MSTASRAAPDTGPGTGPTAWVPGLRTDPTGSGSTGSDTAGSDAVSGPVSR